MKIHVLRGSCQIGGSIIEVCSDNTRLILDAGSQLDEPSPPDIPSIDGLFTGTPAYDAVLVSHGHRDHTGLLNAVLPGIPIYMGQKTFDLLKLSTERTHGTITYAPVFFDAVGERCDGSLHFTIGDITITPYLCDHSAFDSHMFLLSCENECVLYTGDFRSNGRKNFDALLSRLPKHVDKLIMEGTTLGNEGKHKSITESALEDQMAALMQGDAPVFVLSATTHMDRMVTIYRAAKKAGRTMAVDSYQAKLLTLAGGGIPTPATHGIRVVQVTKYKSEHATLQQFSRQKIRRYTLAKQRFVLCVRANQHWVKWIDHLSKQRDLKGSILIYSLWSGYRQRSDMNAFLTHCESLGMNIQALHTSGHADKATLMRLWNYVGQPRIIPVHTEHPEAIQAWK